MPKSEFSFFENIEDLDSESKNPVLKAKEATKDSYAPYSKFYMGAALILEYRTVVQGANQENAAYPLFMCAERIALYAAASQHPGKKIKKLAVVAHKKSHKDLTPAAPCGSCRQVILEYEQRQKSSIELIMLGPEEKWITCAT